MRAHTLALSLALVLIAAAATAQPDECSRCHAGLPDARLSAPAADVGAADVHRARGFGCVDCHGGDPAAPDAAKAKAPATGFRGVPRGATQVQMCARCHGDATVMRTFAPQQRVDQAIEHAASGHGTRLARGDTRVATCASCHGAHGVRAVTDVQAPVHAANVAATCGSCHADSAHMKRPDGTSPPITQKADYETSVHFEALTKKRDLSAPTCNDCHGNHGAAPPGVDAVSNVCGTCHAVYATKFATSPHQPIFTFACVECHGNHAIAKPTDDMLGTDEKAICAGCHTEAGDPGRTGANAMRAGIERLKMRILQTSGVIERVKEAGMDVGDQELAIGDARDRLVLARTEIHAFNPTLVDPIVGEGVAILDDVNGAGERALSELRFRRQGLAVTLGLILVMVVALTMKIRRIDRRRES